jgi:BirA family biotin operon repressor/biotin-[acetyl-CoA-carboxylase] ligase
MERDWVLKITYLKSVDSTQTYLKNAIKKNLLDTPHAIVAFEQRDGLGSRGNKWESIDGNLFLSFAIALDDLAQDLRLESASIYFAYLLKESLSEYGSSVWLKWPNDFYIDDLKIGGMITNVVSDTLVCGVGLNLVSSPDGFSTLDIKLSTDKLLEKYFQKIKKKISWKQVFSKYKLEFHKSQIFFTHKNSLKVSLDGAKLQEDGSVLLDDERIYSLR